MAQAFLAALVGSVRFVLPTISPVGACSQSGGRLGRLIDSENCQWILHYHCPEAECSPGIFLVQAYMCQGVRQRQGAGGDKALCESRYLMLQENLEPIRRIFGSRYRVYSVYEGRLSALDNNDGGSEG